MPASAFNSQTPSVALHGIAAFDTSLQDVSIRTFQLDKRLGPAQSTNAKIAFVYHLVFDAKVRTSLLQGSLGYLPECDLGLSLPLETCFIQNPGWLFYIGGLTTQVYRDCLV